MHFHVKLNENVLFWRDPQALPSFILSFFSSVPVFHLCMSCWSEFVAVRHCCVVSACLKTFSHCIYYKHANSPSLLSQSSCSCPSVSVHIDRLKWSFFLKMLPPFVSLFCFLCCGLNCNPALLDICLAVPSGKAPFFSILWQKKNIYKV